MKNSIYFLFISLMLFSCNDEKICCTNIDTYIGIRLVNTQGENILDQPNGINSTDITILNKKGNEWVEYYADNLDYPKGFMVYDRDGESYLRLFPDGDVFYNNLTETEICYLGQDSDIIKSQIDLSNGNMICTRVWLNGILKWETHDGERIIQITK